MPDHRAAEPLLEIARGNPALSRHLRQSLEVLRERTDDKDFRRQLDDVLAGRLSLRKAALTGTFDRGLRPLFEQGIRRWRELPEEERERLAGQGRVAFDSLNADIEAGYQKEHRPATAPTPDRPPPPADTATPPDPPDPHGRAAPAAGIPTVQESGLFNEPSSPAAGDGDPQQ